MLAIKRESPTFTGRGSFSTKNSQRGLDFQGLLARRNDWLRNRRSRRRNRRSRRSFVAAAGAWAGGATGAEVTVLAGATARCWAVGAVLAGTGAWAAGITLAGAAGAWAAGITLAGAAGARAVGMVLAGTLRLSGRHGLGRGNRSLGRPGSPSMVRQEPGRPGSPSMVRQEPGRPAWSWPEARPLGGRDGLRGCRRCLSDRHCLGRCGGQPGRPGSPSPGPGARATASMAFVQAPRSQPGPRLSHRSVE